MIAVAVPLSTRSAYTTLTTLGLPCSPDFFVAAPCFWFAIALFGRASAWASMVEQLAMLPPLLSGDQRRPAVARAEPRIEAQAPHPRFCLVALAFWDLRLSCACLAIHFSRWTSLGGGHGRIPGQFGGCLLLARHSGAGRGHAL